MFCRASGFYLMYLPLFLYYVFDLLLEATIFYHLKNPVVSIIPAKLLCLLNCEMCPLFYTNCFVPQSEGSELFLVVLTLV